MSKPLMRHPEDEQLLRYADGELPARSTGEVRSHLEACWQCRAQLEELHETVTQCVGYRKNVLQRHLPAPPAPWTDIYQRFAEVDATLLQPSLFQRAVSALRWPVENPRRWVPIAAALMIVWGLFYRVRLMPSVQAAELLRKAVAASDARPMRPHRIEIRTREHRLTRTTGQKLASNSADTQTLQSLQALFIAANYDWNDPLSAKSYQAWRSQLNDKKDEVVQEQDSYRVRTDTASGEMKDASLTLKKSDLQPVQGRFEFRDGEWVEITAVADETAPSTEAASVGNAPEPRASLPSSPAPATTIAPTVAPPTIADELHVIAALHKVGADLGDPLEIQRTASEILVSGTGIAPARQQEIQEAIGSQPRVSVRFSNSAPDAARPQRGTTETPAGADLRQMQARVAEQIGGRANFEQLASEVLDLSEPMMSRVYALRRLAERFPADAEAQLSAGDRQLLRQIQREHVAALRQQTAELDRLLKPMRARGAGGNTSGAISAATWQPATEELFQSARRVEKLLAVIFGAAPSDSADDQLPGQLLSSLAQLRAKVEVYDRLSTKMER